jgi:4-amino-4-deoxy-L-arabinose transferase-like glycosyltransferase
MSKKLTLFLVVLFLFQLIVSGCFELAHDEAYYWLFSKNLAWGYFDHPPMVGVTIALFSFLPHTEWAVRIGFILEQIAALILLLKLLPTAYQWRATLLFLAFPLASVSGLFALPDMPLLFMTAVYCWMLKRYLENDKTMNSIGMAVVVSLLLYAKYHGILLIFFTLVAIPRLLLRKSFYLVTILSMLLFLPHVWWQYQHDFSTLRYHFLERPTSSFNLKRIGEYIGLQIVLAGVLAGPVLWWNVIRQKTRNDFDRAMKVMGVGIILFFLVSTISKKFEANWTILAAIPLVYLAAPAEIWNKRWARSLLYVSFALVTFLRLVLVFPPETFGMKRAREFHGWKEWSAIVKKLCGERKLVANTYQIASKLSYYLNQEVPALNYHSRKNQFDYWNFQQSFWDSPVCYLTDKQEFHGEIIPSPWEKDLKLVFYTSARELWKVKDEQATPQ